MTDMQPVTCNLQLSHGFLILDKPEGISSARAVAEVKKLLGCKKIGHGGTLDPLASGILPLAIGEATKAFDYVAGSIKEYRFTVTFGEQRATDDSEGEVVARTDTLPDVDDIQRALPEFTGTILQTPPVYSALKVDGERAYKRARAGERVEMTPREIEIYTLKLEDSCKLQVAGCKDSLPATCNTQHATFLVACGKGTYVRALARDIARKCNSLGYISMLRRTRVGKFDETQAISLEKLPALMHTPALFKAWMPIELALDDIPAIDMDSAQAAGLRHGKTVRAEKPDGRYMALHQGRIVALVECAEGVLRSQRVFNLNP
jgi:tRNA pseudouridine55 synthase